MSDEAVVRSLRAIDDIVARFPDARKNGTSYTARCPAHDDHRASLSLDEGDDGRVLLHCHAGCTVEAIVVAVGLALRDLFPRKGTKRQVAAEYPYCDEVGVHLYDVVRYDPKDFSQRRADGAWTMKGVRRVLYRLPDLQGKAVVCIAEGERDVDRLRSLGLTATTNVGGAGKWKADYTKQLLSAAVQRVVILSDNDDAGRRHADQVAASCHAAGLMVTVITLPDLPPKGDVSDWLNAGHDKAELLKLAEATPMYMPTYVPTVFTPDAEPTPVSPIALADALDAVQTFVRQYVVLSLDQLRLIVLWIAQTHVLDAFDYVAYLHIQSPMPECGKTRLLEVLEPLVRAPWMTGRVTAAVLMRKVDAEHPTLLLDESDAAFAGDEQYAEALRGMLNSGFHRSGKASVCVGPGGNVTYKDFSTFAPKAIAGIGRLPGTVESRSIPIALKRRTKEEPVAKWRRRTAWPAATAVREQLHTAVLALVEALKVAEPALSVGLSDRAEDVLEPLVAIADAAGGEWPAASRSAAVALMGTTARVAQETDQHLGLELLADIQTVLAQNLQLAVLPTKTILQALVTMDDRPWAAFGKAQKAVTSHWLAKQLKAFGVKPAGQSRIHNDVVRGYRADAFADAFARYLPSEALQRDNPNETGPELPETQPLHGAPVTHTQIAENSNMDGVCNAVTLVEEQEADGTWMDII